MAKKNRIVRTSAGAEKYGVEIGQPIPEKDALGRPITVLVGGQRLVKVHAPDKCHGDTCPIHHISDHHMKDWPQNWRPDRGIMERICSHGIGHPDPDDYIFKLFPYEGIHGCDLCCHKPDEADCNVQLFSSRVCEKGTKSCVTYHE